MKRSKSSFDDFSAKHTPCTTLNIFSNKISFFLYKICILFIIFPSGVYVFMYFLIHNCTEICEHLLWKKEIDAIQFLFRLDHYRSKTTSSELNSSTFAYWWKILERRKTHKKQSHTSPRLTVARIEYEWTRETYTFVTTISSVSFRLW